MKSDPSANLSSLATKFLALMHMREQEILYLGEIQSSLNITAKQEINLLALLSKKGYIVRLKRGVFLIPKKLPPGGKWQPSSNYLIKQFMQIMKANYYIGGQTAFHHYGLVQQIPNVLTVYNNKLSGRKQLGKLTVQLIKIPKERIGAIAKIKLLQGGDFYIASLARTILDAISDWSRYDTLPQAYEWINEKSHDTVFLKELVNATVKYGNVSSKRRIGYYLFKITGNAKLVKPIFMKLKKAQGWIPLLPTKNPQGTTNKEWRIIDNVEQTK